MMSEYTEKRTVVEEDVPIKRARPVTETQYESVVHESRGMSGGAVAALVLAAIAAAVVITMLIINSQQRSEEELAQERARAALAEQTPAQQPQQQPAPVIIMPPSQPTTTPVPVPVPVPTQAAPTPAAPTSTEIELDVTSKMLDDQDLRSASVDVKVSGGTAVLSGRVPSDELKARAEKLARSAKGVTRVINNITVQTVQP
ncbi:MAG: BON domain-containing protein [Blastocatellia bacterium]